MRVAVVGGGISGLTAAYLLARRHDVELFEASARLGGHTLTVDVEEPGGGRLAVDMGFIVYNDWTYPNFARLLGELGVASAPSSMSFSVRCERTGLEYNGSTINQLFAQRRNLVRLSFQRMVLDILRFNRRALSALDASESLTVRQFVARGRFSRPFVEHYLVPMIAAIWSTRPEHMLEFPMRPLAAFLNNHGLLSVNRRPEWRFIEGGARTYLDRLAGALGDRVRTSAPVRSVRRSADAVEVTPVEGPAERFDEVVLATHSDQALALLSDPTPEEREILGAIPYQPNDVVLHTDSSFLPRRRRAWASWNYHHNTPSPDGVQMTYYLNSLERLESDLPYCVTLNRTAEIDERKILRREVMSHPLFTREGMAAQERWGEVSGRRRTHYCGAYWGYGFHEDGVVSAARVAGALGVGW